MCNLVVVSNRLYPLANQEEVYILQEDKLDKLCPKYKGETPLEIL